jgi:hypothetical protein
VAQWINRAPVTSRSWVQISVGPIPHEVEKRAILLDSVGFLQFPPTLY